MDVKIFGIDLYVEPIAFSLFGSWTVYWYGIIIAAGFTVAVVYALFNYKRFNLDVDRMIDVVLVTTPLAILGARLYYMIFYYGRFGIKEFFGIGNAQGFSGLAIYGGVIGAALVGFIMCKIRKVNILDMSDIAAIGFMVAQGIGRWGNFMNQEAFGGPTGSSWWGMTSENVVENFIQNGYDPTALAHPCFLYESVWCIIGFFVLHLLSKNRKFSGQVALMYCVWYGFGRAIIESFRTDSLMIGQIRVSMLVSLIICIGAAALMLVLLKKKTNINEEYTPMFEDSEDVDGDFLEDEAHENN